MVWVVHSIGWEGEPWAIFISYALERHIGREELCPCFLGSGYSWGFALRAVSQQDLRHTFDQMRVTDGQTSSPMHFSICIFPLLEMFTGEKWHIADVSYYVFLCFYWLPMLPQNKSIQELIKKKKLGVSHNPKHKPNSGHKTLNLNPK